MSSTCKRAAREQEKVRESSEGATEAGQVTGAKYKIGSSIFSPNEPELIDSLFTFACASLEEEYQRREATVSALTAQCRLRESRGFRRRKISSSTIQFTIRSRGKPVCCLSAIETLSVSSNRMRAPRSVSLISAMKGYPRWSACGPFQVMTIWSGSLIENMSAVIRMGSQPPAIMQDAAFH